MHQIEFEWVTPITEELDYREMDFSYESELGKHVHDVIFNNKAMSFPTDKLHNKGNEIIREYVDRRAFDKQKLKTQLAKDGYVI